MLLGVQDFVLRNCDIKSLDFDIKLIPTCGSVGTFSVSGLNDEHSLSINDIVIEQTRAIADGLVGLGVKEIGELGLGDGQVIFTTRYSDLTLLGPVLFKVGCLTFDKVFLLENTRCVNG